MADLRRERGDTYPVPREVRSTETGSVVDITGWTIKVTVSSKPHPADTSSQVFTLNATITDATNGKYQWAPSTSDADKVGRMFFGTVATKNDGTIETLETGLYTVMENVK